MRILAQSPRFSSVYVVHASGLSRTPEIERLTQKLQDLTLFTNPSQELLDELTADPKAKPLLNLIQWMPPEERIDTLRALRSTLFGLKNMVNTFRTTYQNDLTRIAGTQIGKNPFIVGIPEKKALFLQHHWHKNPNTYVPGVTAYQHWLQNKIERLESRADIQHAKQHIAHNELEDSPIEIRIQEAIERAQNMFRHWESKRGNRTLLFVDDEKGLDGTKMKQTFQIQQEALNRMETVSLPHVLPLRGLDPDSHPAHIRTNRSNLNYSWYTSTLMSAHINHQEDIANPVLDGILRLELEELRPPQDTAKYTYRVKAQVNDKTFVIGGKMKEIPPPSS